MNTNVRKLDALENACGTLEACQGVINMIENALNDRFGLLSRGVPDGGTIGGLYALGMLIEQAKDAIEAYVTEEYREGEAKNEAEKEECPRFQDIKTRAATDNGQI